MTSELRGKIALVTGAGRGIGRAIGLLLGQRGVTVVATARTASEVETVVGEIEAAGGKGRAVAGDITEEKFVERLFDIIREEFGRLDALVNNAGIGEFAPIEDMPVERLRASLEVNVVGPFMCMQQAIRLMMENGGRGKIVNVGSVRSHWTEAGDAGAYNASKYALRGLTESVARQLHGTGCRIGVGLVCPGVVDTTLTNPKGEPRPEWLEPETVARAVLHALEAPEDVNVFDTILFPTFQKPW
ncbi:MAG: SDR family oxidoreductase [Gemmatimonadetes bacterium]|jgi:3-oxoacyl-[acyl-carrier protein] reductase|nr:SDR family oxidoreductase [Gemmatimonadota bacterium]